MKNATKRRSFALLVLPTLLAISASTVCAESGSPADQRVEIDVQTRAVTAELAVLKHRELDAIFSMSSGRHLSVLSAGDAISVRYGRLPEATLRHYGQGSFVSQDRKVMPQFETDTRGEPQQVRLILPTTWR